MKRGRIVIAVLVVIIAVVAVLAISVGAYTVAPADLLATLTGHGSTKDQFIVLRLRLPRVALAALVGIAFALAGAIFQSLLSNPLASPDVIGITGGASAAAVAAILIVGASGAVVSLAAFGGAVVVASAIYALSWRAGMSGFRFVLIGIGFAFIVQAVIGYLLTRADVRDAQTALVWLVGSIGGATWEEIATAAIGLAILLPLLAMVVPKLRVLQLGDDSAVALGLPVGRVRLALLAIAVGLAALGTAAVGPLAFVAFVSAPIARRLVSTGGLALVPSALVGAAIVLVADFAAQHLIPGGAQVPAGILTGAIGAPYLLWVLARMNRTKGTA